MANSIDQIELELPSITSVATHSDSLRHKFKFVLLPANTNEHTTHVESCLNVFSCRTIYEKLKEVQEMKLETSDDIIKQINVKFNGMLNTYNIINKYLFNQYHQRATNRIMYLVSTQTDPETNTKRVCKLSMEDHAYGNIASFTDPTIPTKKDIFIVIDTEMKKRAEDESGNSQVKSTILYKALPQSQISSVPDPVSQELERIKLLYSILQENTEYDEKLVVDGDFYIIKEPIEQKPGKQQPIEQKPIKIKFKYNGEIQFKNIDYNIKENWFTYESSPHVFNSLEQILLLHPYFKRNVVTMYIIQNKPKSELLRDGGRKKEIFIKQGEKDHPNYFITDAISVDGIAMELLKKYMKYNNANNIEQVFHKKYLLYKQKYLNLKKLII